MALRVPEQATPATPATGYSVLYPKADGLWYFTDDGGIERPLQLGFLDGVTSRATNTILGVADKAKAFLATGSFTQTFDAAATLLTNWYVHYRVPSGQTITFDPDSTEQIDGATTKVVVGPAAGYIVCDGSGLHTFGFDSPAASDTVAGRIEVAVQSEMEAGTDATRAVAPARQHFHPSAAKAWVLYKQTTTPAIHSSYNVNSVDDDAAGSFTVHWETDFSDTNYATAATVQATTTVRLASTTSNRLVDQQSVLTETITGGDEDAISTAVVAFGDH